MSTGNNHALAFTALNTYVLTMSEGVTQLRTTFVSLGLGTAEDARPVVLAWASDKYACPLVTSESNRNKGQQVLDRSHAAFMRADKAFKRAMEDLMGDADAKVSAKAEGEAEEYEIPEELLKAAQRLATLAQQYEGSRKWASRALAAAFAK
jgi:hypothetical protein